MKIEWHAHSTYSDGHDSLEQLFKQAQAQQLTHLAVVDHDTTAHHAEGQELAKQYGITFIPGVEISAYDFKRQRKVHVLGYGLPENCSNIKQLCAPLLARRHTHSLWQLSQIQQAGWQIETAHVLAKAQQSGTLYKQHIMDVLLDMPYTAPEYQTLYRTLFKQRGVAAGDIAYIDVFDAIAAIRADGGLAVLAHPGQLDSYDVVAELVPHGLNGIELRHPDHTVADHLRIEGLASRYNLFQTGGSDYHGSYGADVSLGQFAMDTLPTQWREYTKR